MTNQRLMVLAATTFVLGATTAAAQGQQMTLRPDSKLELTGSSNVHDWACKSAAFVAKVEVDPAFAILPIVEGARPINKASVTIPVKSLKCGSGKMESNMSKALNAEQYPDIQYSLTTYTIDAATATADSFVVKTLGDLTVAGQTIKVEIPITTHRLAGGSARGEGTVNLKMTDFGIKPPVALLGTLRTKDKISISFSVLLDKSGVVALSQF